MPNDYWSGFLQDNPDILYYGMLPKTGPQNFLNYWRGQYGNVYNNYLGDLGRSALGGNMPNTSFYDYLLQNPIARDWQKLTSGQRGERQPMMARWNLGW